MKTVARVIGGIIGLVITAGWALGFMMDTGAVPSDRVQASDEIDPRHVAVLIDEGIIHYQENVEYLFSEGLVSVREGGSVLTDRRVIAWQQRDDGRIAARQISNADIRGVELLRQGDDYNYAVYLVFSADGSVLELWLPHEHGDAERFVAAVEAKFP